jgi:histidinol dehydrogenase
MRIVQLTEEHTESFLRSRQRRDVEALRVAEKIVADVRRRGDAAVIAWTVKFDGAPARVQDIWVPAAERRNAAKNVSRELMGALQRAARNIRRVATQQRPRAWSTEVEPGVRVSQRVLPIETVGCYIPGGRHSLVSTLLMTAIPAQVAGVPRVIVACPKPSAALLAAAEMLGLTEIARVGGAQAIAAMAYGTKSIARVDKIFGPGNRWVDAAKRIVSSDCAVDLPAGPTELLVVAERGNPEFIAADMIAQAEHDPDAMSVLVTTSQKLATGVADAIDEQLAWLPGSNPARKSLARPGTILLAKNRAAALKFANQFAPEHLSLPDGAELLGGIQSAGSIFIGPWSAQPFGDYSSGTNHVLPTAGWARSRGGLSTADFVKCVSVQHVTRAGIAGIGRVARGLAEAEDLTAHARAATIRNDEAGRERTVRSSKKRGGGAAKKEHDL